MFGECVETLLSAWPARAASVAAHQADEGDPDALVAVVKETLVEDGEQRVEDSAVGLEDLVNEGHAGLRQVALRLPDVLIVL